MPQTISTTLNNVAAAVGIGQPASYVGNTQDETAGRLLRAAEQAGRYLASRHDWRALTFEHTFTTVSGTLTYSVPTSPRFHHFFPATGYDRSANLMMVGPMTANRFQSGEAERLNPVGLTQRFRFRADTSDRAVTQFRFLDDPAGAFQIAYEYVTDEWVKQGGGVYSNSIAADSNTVLFDDVLFEAECMWRVLRALGEPFFDEKDEAVRLTEALISQESGRTIKLRDRPFLGENVPEGNWPTP